MPRNGLKESTSLSSAMMNVPSPTADAGAVVADIGSSVAPSIPRAAATRMSRVRCGLCPTL